jgi:polyisoprenoid-binding protein YceI
MKFLLAATALALGALTLSQPATAADYLIDTKGAHASVNWRIKHLGFSWLTGRFDTFSGTFSYDKDKPEASKVKVEIDTTSLNSNHAERDKHIKSPDFIDAAKFPKATFESTSVKANGTKATITGNLTLRGVTKEVVIEADYVGGGPDPWGGARDGFAGTTTLKLADFGMDVAKFGPAMATVELELNVEGVKK